jgi:hypothetical protein
MQHIGILLRNKPCQIFIVCYEIIGSIWKLEPLPGIWETN